VCSIDLVSTDIKIVGNENIEKLLSSGINTDWNINSSIVLTFSI